MLLEAPPMMVAFLGTLVVALWGFLMFLDLIPETDAGVPAVVIRSHIMAFVAFICGIGAFGGVVVLLWSFRSIESGISPAQLALVGILGVSFGFHMALEMSFQSRRFFARRKAAEEKSDPERAGLLTSAPDFRLCNSFTQEHLKGSRAMSELTLILMYVFICDRTTLVAEGQKVASSAYFWGVNGVVFLFAAFSVRESTSKMKGAFLNRDQTEEWKGWMQTQFLLYHYFMAESMYNNIRIYIASYVWMTGYGNAIYYYKTSDFGLMRFVAMMWRLNFLTIFLCVLLQNEYMLYYIVPMHTLFTWMVYFTLFIYYKSNSNDTFLVTKMAITTAIVAVMWNNTRIFHTIWGPFSFLLGFHDPLHPEFTDALHEWEFRSHLDHLIWLVGMVLGLFMAHKKGYASLQTWAATLPPSRLLNYKALFYAFVAAVAVVYMNTIWLYPKRASQDAPWKGYNMWHPFTSFIPIVCYVILRNCTEQLRSKYLHMFTYMGRVTLETYVLQFHIWMKTTGINGSPKTLMMIIPPGFLAMPQQVAFFVNMALVSSLYVFVSIRAFKVTVAAKDAFVPKEASDFYTRSVFASVIIVSAYLIALFTVSLLRLY